MKKQKPHLSCSSIRAFLDCNKKYQYQYLDKINVPQNQSVKHLSFGKSIHRALAKFNRITDQSQRNIDTLHALLRKNWVRKGYSSIEEERAFGLRGLDMLTRYYEDPKDQGKETILIEEMLSIDLKEYILDGVLDKVYVTHDNNLEIIDYKTGNNMYPLDNLQLPIYLFLSKEKLGVYPNLVSYYFLSHNKKYTREVTKELINDLSMDIHNLCTSIIKTKDFHHNSTPYCKSNCQYYQLCSILNFKCNHSFNINTKLKH